MHIEPAPTAIPIRDLNDRQRIEWTIVRDAAGDRGEITVRAGTYCGLGVKWLWRSMLQGTAMAHKAMS